MIIISIYQNFNTEFKTLDHTELFIILKNLISIKFYFKKDLDLYIYKVTKCSIADKICINHVLTAI